MGVDSTALKYAYIAFRMQNLEGTKAFWVDDTKPMWKRDLNKVKAILKTNV